MSVTLHTTHGTLKLELYIAAAPKSCENFLAHCASGYYDGVPFHRSIAGFMAQTGDGELRTGKGGKSIWGGFFEDEISAALRHSTRGVVSMANKGEGTATNGSQFFITYAPQRHLDGRNTVFGKVGMAFFLSRGGCWRQS
jgi:peptidyl-prolyl cis-trans isomerase-like 3